MRSEHIKPNVSASVMHDFYGLYRRSNTDSRYQTTKLRVGLLPLQENVRLTYTTGVQAAVRLSAVTVNQVDNWLLNILISVVHIK